MIKQHLTALCLASMMTTTFAASEQKINLESKQDKISYSIGIDIGKSFKEQNIGITEQAFLAGVRDGQANTPVLMTDAEIRETLVGLQTELMEKQKEAIEKMSAKNKQEGEQYLAENQKRDDVKTTESGLQYRVITEGKGSSPSATDQVVTHYRGKLIDGTEFDSSYTRGQPATFPVSGVIAGWTEALQIMKPGSKWELFVPADLAYGEQGVGDVIPPNAVLNFEVELISVVDKKKAP